MRIGEQLKKLRERKKMSLTALSKNSGIQIATLSRIENNKMTGTLESHLAIAKALSIDITELYQNLQQEEPINSDDTNSTDTPLPILAGQASQEILARQITAKKMLPTLIKIEPHGATAAETFPPGTERFLYILEGVIEVKLKSQTVRLTARTSLYFTAAQTHNLENTGDKIAKLISVTTPVTL